MNPLGFVTRISELDQLIIILASLHFDLKMLREHVAKFFDGFVHGTDGDS